MNKAPYGWKQSADGKLLPNEHEQEVIRLARELRRAGLSFREVAAELASRGFVARLHNPGDEPVN